MFETDGMAFVVMPSFVLFVNLEFLQRLKISLSKTYQNAASNASVNILLRIFKENCLLGCRPKPTKQRAQRNLCALCLVATFRLVYIKKNTITVALQLLSCFPQLSTVGCGFLNKKQTCKTPPYSGGVFAAWNKNESKGYTSSIKLITVIGAPSS